MAKTLLLYSSRPEDRVFAEEAGRIADLEVKVCEGLSELVAEIQSGDPGAILIDASSEERFAGFEKAIQEEIGIFNEKANTNLFHYLSSQDLELSKFLAQSPLFGSFVLRKFSTPEAARAAAGRYGYVIAATLKERAFGLKSFFSAKSQIQVIRLKKSNQKQQIVEAIRAYLLKAKYPSRMANVIANAIDELVMNAIFAAPTDEFGKRILDSTPRDSVFELNGKQEVEVCVAFDGRQVGICAADQYGAIDKEKLLRHLSTVYTDDQYKVRSAVAGAGIGLSTTFRHGGSLVFTCEKNTRTEVAVIFERFDSYREFKDQFRFVCTQFYFS